MRRDAFRLALAFPVLAASVALGTENYGARAELRATDGKRYPAQVTISIDRMLTPDERKTLVAAFKAGDPEALRKALAGQEAIGYIDRGRVKASIKFAYSRPSGKGKMVTLACDEPIKYFGGDIPDVTPKPGFDLTYILLSLDGDGNGTGEIVPGAKMRVREDGLLAVAEYGAETIDLEDVAKEK